MARPAGEVEHREPPRRVLLAAGSEEPDELLARLGRSARDAGDEVVLLGSGVAAEVVAATAVQEDVDAVLLAGGDDASYDDRLRAALAALGAGDVVVRREGYPAGYRPVT